MANTLFENAIIITAETRLQKLLVRFNTLANARFYMERKGQASDFEDLIREDAQINMAVKRIQSSLGGMLRIKKVEKSFLPNFIFSENDLVLVIGQDGLVANTAKYATQNPIMGINPDPDRYDGILLPFDSHNFMKTAEKLVYGKSYDLEKSTMAKVSLDDGQELLAFNDFFIGPQSHTSARYKIRFHGKMEQQSSSGLIVSTGAGSTGWMSSVFNMTKGIVSAFGEERYLPPLGYQIHRDADTLLFAVREPFQSRTSHITMVGGAIQSNDELIIESLMPQNGIIFSDGILEDFIRFTSGMVAKIRIAEEKANLVTN